MITTEGEEREEGGREGKRERERERERENICGLLVIEIIRGILDIILSDGVHIWLRR